MNRWRVRGPTAVDYAENGTDAVATYTFHGTSPPVEWSLSGADGGEFSIDANGVLTFNRQPDYENPTDAANENAYLVTITAYAGDRVENRIRPGQGHRRERTSGV